jgi:hypothetical protein
VHFSAGLYAEESPLLEAVAREWLDEDTAGWKKAWQVLW